MDMKLLRYFIAIYEEKNIAAAARKCLLSRDALSNALTRMEEELETVLAIRHNDEVTLTDDAHYLYPIACRILNDSGDLKALFKKSPNFQRLTMGLFPSLSPSRISAALKSIKETVPDLALELTAPEAPCDARITPEKYKKEKETFLPLWEEDYLICMHKNHPLAEAEFLFIEDLHNYEFILSPPCDAHQQTISILSGSGLKLNVTARAEQKSQVLHLVRAGFGISILPSGVLEYARNIAAIPFKGPRMFRRIGLCHPAGRKLSPPLSQVVEKLTNI